MPGCVPSINSQIEQSGYATGNTDDLIEFRVVDIDKPKKVGVEYAKLSMRTVRVFVNVFASNRLSDQTKKPDVHQLNH